MCFHIPVSQEEVRSQMEPVRGETGDITMADRQREICTREKSIIHCDQESNMSQDNTSEEDDNMCSYPKCNCPTSEVTWPFCYGHSPDTGWAPGGVLYCLDKFVQNATDNKEIATIKTISEHSNSDHDVEDKHKDEAQLPDPDSEPDDEEDICSYPGCDVTAPEATWPFCYQHSPDSGLAPGGLLYCSNKYLEQERGCDSVTS